MARLPCTLLAGLLLSAAGLSAQQSQPASGAPLDQAKAGEVFRVIGHGVSEELVAEARRLVAAVPAAFARVTGSEVQPEQPLEVHLYGTIAAYRDSDRKRTGGRFQRNLACALWGDMTAHVALQPDAAPEVYDAIGLPLLTRRLLCHEACHVLRYTDCPNRASHPGWLADGLACEVSWRALEQVYPHTRQERSPLWGAEVRRVQELAQEGRLPAITDLLLDRTSSLEFRERYGSRFLWTRYLADKHPGLLRAAYKTCRRLGGGQALTGGLQAEVVRMLDKLGVADGIDRAFAVWLRSLSPTWRQAGRNAEWRGDEMLQVAFSNTNSMAVRTESIGASGGQWSGSFAPIAGEKFQANLLLGVQGGRFHQVSFHNNQSLVLFRFDEAAETQWRRIAAVVLPDSVREAAAAGPLAFQVSWDASSQELLVRLNGVLVFGRVVDLEPEGEWGVGALAGSGFRWSGLRFQRAGD